MAVTSILKGWTGMSAGGDYRTRHCMEVYSLTTDSGTDGPVFAWPITSGGTIPARGTVHGTFGGYYSNEPQVERRGPMLWEVRVFYATPDPREGQQYADPLDEPADVEGASITRTVPYDRDLDDVLLVNSFGDPFDPPVTRELKDIVLRIGRNQAAATTILTYIDTVCEEVVSGHAIGRARMVDLRNRLVHHEQGDYYRTEYEIHFRARTPPGTTDAHAWFKCVLDAGMKYKDDAGDEHSSDNGKPVLLDATGKKTTPAAPHWLYFREYFSASWTALGL